MKRMAVAAGLAVLALALANGYAEEEKKQDAKGLFENKCSQCHSLDRPRSKKKTGAEWEATVMRMKNVNGCPITDDEAKAIIEYLTKTYGKEAGPGYGH